ncbi:MAG: hypothetical protein GX280_01515 [Lentisphaerae bacterium]|nr:hypothetical protein [Victivallaceae bacterium]MDD3703578.1 hypothetical protein [Victivallaceae bacterium]MDD5663099.1 hypothetical protein [Victivallaceae bacterium]NLK82745.1 hypothetical protein [Lentisphaerota bacterium]
MNKLLAIFMLTAGCTLCTAQEASKREEETKIAALKQQAEEVNQQMAKVRVEVIKKDPELQKLHQQILALHRELALRVDSKRDMRILILKSETIERELREISLKKTTPKK